MTFDKLPKPILWSVIISVSPTRHCDVHFSCVCAKLMFLEHPLYVMVAYLWLLSSDCRFISTCDRILHILCSLYDFLRFLGLVDVVDEQGVVAFGSYFLLPKWSFVLVFKWLQGFMHYIRQQCRFVFSFFIEWTAYHLYTVGFCRMSLISPRLPGVQVQSNSFRVSRKRTSGD